MAARRPWGDRPSGLGMNQSRGPQFWASHVQLALTSVKHGGAYKPSHQLNGFPECKRRPTFLQMTGISLAGLVYIGHCKRGLFRRSGLCRVPQIKVNQKP